MASLLLLLILLVVTTTTTTTTLVSSQSITPLPISSPGGEQQPLPTPAVDHTGLKSFTNGKGFYKRMAREFLEVHNQVRGQEGESPYRWNRKLARFARRWTETRRLECTMVHSQGPYGENMFWGTGWDWRAGDAVRSWAQEKNYYIRGNNSCQPGQMCGHFTQVVWNSTVRVGCARVECYNGGVIISCNYDPPGNWLNESPFGIVV